MKAKMLDLAERIILVLFAAGFLARFAQYIPSDPHLLLLMASEFLVVLFVVARPWGGIMADKPYPIAVAFLGSMFPLFAVPSGSDPAFVSVGGLVMFSGLVLSVTGKMALNRRFGMIAANRGVQVRGPYAFVRHPIYTGYLITHIGFLITNPVLWNLVIYVAGTFFQVLRIYEEEKVLSQDPVYGSYKARVGYRVFPGVF